MYYGVIGTQEDIQTSLCVMERYIPLFFKGVVQIYNEMGKEQEHQTQNEIRKENPEKNLHTNGRKENRRNRRNRRKSKKKENPEKNLHTNGGKLLSSTAGNSIHYVRNETPNKKELSKLARSILVANMTLDYEFYEFVKQRLQLQKERLVKQSFPLHWCKYVMRDLKTQN